MRHLNNIQKWMQGIITTPYGVPIEMDAISENTDWNIDTIISPSNSLTSHERINIYHKSYFTRLLDCFKSEYSGLLNALGDELFNHFVWSYLQEHPSTSYTLNNLGKNFSDFLQKTLNETLNEQSPDWWQLFIIDISKYEKTFTEVFNGFGHEEFIANDFFSTHPLKLSPAIKILQLNFPIAECINEFKKNKSNVFPEIQQTNYVFTRHDFVVKAYKISNKEYYTLQKWVENSFEKCPIEYQIDWKIKRICY